MPSVPTHEHAVRRAEKIKKMYSGSLKITNMPYSEEYEDPSSTAFKDLAAKVVKQVIKENVL